MIWLVAVIELIGLTTNNERWSQSAYIWSRGLMVLVGGALVSDAIFALQTAVLWPRFLALASPIIGMAWAGSVLSLALAVVGLAVYGLGWGTFRRWRHFMLLGPVLAGGTLALFFQVSADGFMNVPPALTIVDGQTVSATPFMAIFNGATFSEFGFTLAVWRRPWELVPMLGAGGGGWISFSAAF
jgi:cytochrome d ubiquinol oxidase subunit I